MFRSPIVHAFTLLAALVIGLAASPAVGAVSAAQPAAQTGITYVRVPLGGALLVECAEGQLFLNNTTPESGGASCEYEQKGQ